MAIRLALVLLGMMVAAAVTLAFRASADTPTPPIDDFVLFATEGLTIGVDANVISGDVASNDDVDVNARALIDGNVFGDTVSLGQGAVILRDVVSNGLSLANDAHIQGKTHAGTLPSPLPNGYHQASRNAVFTDPAPILHRRFRI